MDLLYLKRLPLLAILHHQLFLILHSTVLVKAKGRLSRDSGDSDVVFAACLLVCHIEELFADTLSNIISVDSQLCQKQEVSEIREGKTDPDEYAYFISGCYADIDVQEESSDSVLEVLLRVL